MFSLFKKNNVSITSLFSNDFIDIHSHLLPNIDDGAKSFEDSVSLIKTLHSFGVNNFVTTPHIMDGVWNNNPEIIQNKLFQLKDYLKTHNLADIKIRAAAEYMLDSNFEHLLDTEKLLTIKDNYLLIEMSYLNPPINLKDLLFKIQIKGYTPILAHPERYVFYHNNYNEYLKLKEAGCLFQLNLLSLSNYYGPDIKKVAIKLLKDGLINFVGTDTHSERHLKFLESINNKKLLKLISPIIENNSILK
ncbi:tyrosine-protein phosphatase [Lutibacter citreus]|uniref:tyrosine-protein phosphatase n=1 Tax=Lutibacter citreus TaxID=2138210 RepID=UPI000DBE321F|nr:CpsB/CapC family capsule biosynthesis tyrosine phosphatase [Lutibacter citreus]